MEVYLNFDYGGNRCSILFHGWRKTIAADRVRRALVHARFQTLGHVQVMRHTMLVDNEFDLANSLESFLEGLFAVHGLRLEDDFGSGDPSADFERSRIAVARLGWRGATQGERRAVGWRFLGRVQTIRVETPTAKYDVVAGSGLLETLAPRIERAIGRLPRRVFVLTSPAIWALWGERVLRFVSRGAGALFLPARREVQDHGERGAAGAGDGARGGGSRSLLIAFGGGIVGDVGGFLAAIFMRGIPYVQVPTTFLAQVDSSWAARRGVNLPEGKNLVGSFHQPRAVFADIGVLGTLPERELKAGLMESVKAGIIRDRALVRFMEENAARFWAGCEGAGEGDCGVDPHEGRGGEQGRARGGLRMILNLGTRWATRSSRLRATRPCCTARRWHGAWWRRSTWRGSGDDFRRAV
jgi:hypothetical protein